MKKTQIIAAVVMMASLVMGGCASKGEKGGFGRDGRQIPGLTGAEELPDLTERSELSDFLAYAALNNAGLKAAFEQWKAAVEQVPQAESLPDPKFTYGYFIEEVETKTGPQRQKVGLMQTFPWFGKIEARTDAAAAAAKAAHKRYEATKLALYFEVKEAFYEYAYLARAIEIAKANLELIKHFEEVARVKYIAMVAMHPDVIRAQVELAKIEDVLKSLEDFRKPVVARLNAVLNRRSFEMLPWPQDEDFPTVQVNRQQLRETLKAQNPELQALDFELQAARSRVELAKKKFWPDIGLGIDWVDIISGSNPLVSMFAMNVPVWRKSYKAAELQANANARKISHQKTQTENTIIARAERVLYDFDDSNRKIKLYGDILIPKAEELLMASETAYKGATVDFLSLVDAQRTLLDYQLRYERAATNHQQKLAELEMLAGEELGEAPGSEEQKNNN